tara:strand:+ start:388 stop:1200 length:813 start_codon:yes stop_codon:yes gene_type:complete
MIKLKNILSEGKRIPRKKGQKRQSSKHSDLYTDENPKGTIHGLKFATVKDAEASISKIKSSGRKHAHKVQAAVAMEQRAKAAGKKSAAAVYRKYINSVKKNEVDYHSRLSRGHKPDYYQLGTSEFKPFDKSRDDLEESVYDDMLKAVPDNYGYKELAMDVANIIKNEYGKHNIKPFQKELAKHLKQAEMEENVAPDHDGKAAPYGSGYKKTDENFADGKKPGRKGLSKRVGVSQKMSIAKLAKIAKTASGERKRMAQWNLNMKRGRKKKK